MKRSTGGGVSFFAQNKTGLGGFGSFFSLSLFLFLLLHIPTQRSLFLSTQKGKGFEFDHHRKRISLISPFNLCLLVSSSHGTME